MAIKDVYQAVLDFEEDNMPSLVQQELDAGASVDEVLNSGLIAAMDEVGKQFSEGELFVPEMLMAAQTMKAGLNVLKPLLAESNAKSRGTIVIGTVKGDLHDIGKNLVSMMLEGAGFTVVDLGVDVDVDAFIKAAEDNKADAICMSALLTTTMPAMEKTVKAITSANLPYKAMVGGAPVTDSFAKQIGANYSEDAAGAVELARKLIAA